jgi:hypothetical protein
MHTNETDIVPATPDATPATVTPVADVTPARRRAPRKPVAPRPTKNRAVDVAGFTPTDINGVWRMATAVTPANIDATVARLNAGFTVNGPGKHIGRFTGRRIVDFQNRSFVENADRKLTDVQLLFVWRVEFPMATGAVFTSDWKTGVRVVRGVRADVNRGGHAGAASGIPAGFRSEPYIGVPVR